MRNNLSNLAAMAAGIAVVLGATAMAGPGRLYRPATTGTTPAPPVVVPTPATLPGAGYPWLQPSFVHLPSGMVHVAVPTAITLPGGRYPWAQPAFVQLANGLIKIVRIAPA